MEKIVGYLKNSRCYLAAPIEADENKSDWRTKVRKTLVRRFKIDLFDPYADPKQQWTEQLKRAKEEENYALVADIAKRFVRKDLCIVDRSDFIIACLPYKVPTAGVVHEIVNSNNAKKPTLIVCPQGKKFVPSWYFGFISHEYMFGSWEELYNYLKEVNDGNHKDDDKWAYVYKIV